MAEFLSRNKDSFNSTQRFALKTIASMAQKDIQLIQGPPGTGKTHTISGLLSMLYNSNKRVLVCTPSNTAVDEIVNRLDD